MKRRVCGVFLYVCMLTLVGWAQVVVADDALQQDLGAPEYHRVLDLYDRGEFSEAIALLEPMVHAALQDPKVWERRMDLADFYYNVGNVYFKGGHLGWALASYLEAAAYPPLSYDLRHNLQHVQKTLSPGLQLPPQLMEEPSFLVGVLRGDEALVWLWWLVAAAALLMGGAWWCYRCGRTWWLAASLFLAASLSALVVWGVVQVPSGRTGDFYGVICCKATSVYSTPGISRVELFELPQHTIVRLEQEQPQRMVHVSNAVGDDAVKSEDQRALRVAFFLPPEDLSLLSSSTQDSWIRGWVLASHVLSWQHRSKGESPHKLR